MPRSIGSIHTAWTHWEAAAILGTTTLRDTIDALMREVVHAERRLELVALLSEDGRFDFDFDVADRAWGGDA